MLLITCPYGLSGILNNELKKMNFSSLETFDTWTYVEKQLQDAYYLNLHSRIANKIYLRLNTPSICTNFDDLFDTTSEIDRSSYIGIWQWVSVKVHLRQSQIDSTKSSQSIIHKAIISKLTWSKDDHWNIDETKPSQQIYVIINKNICSIYINTSWSSLHERWYRHEAWEAPVKENLAAALVQIANWNFKDPLIDPCCGSWTICIEAAMIAKNIAPWLDRYFAFEDFPVYDKAIFEKMRSDAESNIYSKKYTIIWSDIDEAMIETAKKNAKNAWVADDIIFKYGDIHDHAKRDLSLSWSSVTVVSNPPYWLRLDQEDLEEIHSTFATSINKKTVVMTWYSWSKKIFNYNTWSTKKTKNGSEEVNIYVSK